MNKRNVVITNQSGQVAIIILLVMVVLLVVVLSLASRTTQEVFLSGQETESARVFNAAEAGAEEALGNEANFQDVTISEADPITESSYDDPSSADDIDINYTVTPQNELVTYIEEGMTGTVDLDPDGNGVGVTGTIYVRWAKDTGCTDASVIISVYSNDGGASVRHLPYSPDCAVTTVDNFTNSPNYIIPPYNNQVPVVVADTDLYIRVKAIYNGTDLSVSGSSLPVQSHLVRSEAFSEDNGETRAVQVSRSLPAPPAILDYSVYSGTDLIKN